MKISERYKTFDELINKIYEQREYNGLLLHNLLKQNKENRPHYLSLIWQIPTNIIERDNIINDINSIVVNWNNSTFYAQKKNLHLTIASFGKISDSYYTARYLTYKNSLNDIVKGLVSEWKGFQIVLKEATIGASGINIEIDVKDSKVKDYLNKFENVPGLEVQRPKRWSISLLRYLRTTDFYYPIHETQLKLLYNSKKITYNDEVEINNHELKLTLLDKVGESFISI